MGKILIVDDEMSLRQVFTINLKNAGHDVVACKDGVEAINIIKNGGFDLVVTDLKLPGVDGIEVLKVARKFMPASQVIVITAYATTENAIEAMKEGAYDYIIKPFKMEKMLVLVEKAIEKTWLINENIRFREDIARRFSIEDMVGKSKGVKDVFDTIKKAAPTTTNILVLGESGTGKELVARAIHGLSPRIVKPFIVVNCSAIPETLMESELFGYKKGSFTGAVSDKKGLFEAADGGTVFLDEIAEIPPAIQVKLLRVLQERTFRPVGAIADQRLDVRIVAATNKNLDVEVDAGRFRNDLYYRLCTIKVHLPPLRQRRSDIPVLAEYFLKKFALEQGKEIPGFTIEAMELLNGYYYKGNVRQLANIVERAVILTSAGLVGPEAVSGQDDTGIDYYNLSTRDPATGQVDFEAEVAAFEKLLLTRAISASGNDKTVAAESLKMTLRALKNRLDKLGLKV